MDLYRAIDRTAFQFDFLVMKPGKHHFFDEVAEMGGRVFYIRPPREGGPVTFVTEVTGLIRDEGPYLAVHSHTGFNQGLVQFAAWRAHVPVRIAHSRSAPSRYGSGLQAELYTRLMRLLILRYSTELVSCGTAAAAYLFGNRAVADDRVRIVRNAIPVMKWSEGASRMRSEDARQVLRAQLGLPRSGPIIGSVGNLRKVKNHSFLIRVFAEFLKRHPDGHLVIVGDGELRNELEQLTIDLGVESSAVFLGQRDDVMQLLSLFSVVVLPSIYEGIPGVIVEAQACGTPALLSDTIDREVDVMAGLLRYQSLEAPIEDWVADLEALIGLQSGQIEVARERLIAAGYDVATSAGLMTEIYGKGIEAS